jgi:hypothetical protein
MGRFVCYHFVTVTSYSWRIHGLNYNVPHVDMFDASEPVIHCAGVFAREGTDGIGGCKYVPSVPQVLLIYNKCSCHVMKGEGH